MIDIHSHILPKIDDGSTDINTTIQMIRNAEKQGTTSLVATPHFCIGYGETEYLKVKSMVAELKRIVENEEINIELFHGQEVYYTENIVELYKEGIIGTINDTKYMLIELPLKEFDILDILNELYEIKIRGIVPILAHPERYRPFIHNQLLINEFIREEFLFQVNSGSLTGQFGKSVKKTAEIFVKNNIYNFIGSDAHNITNRLTGVSEGRLCAIKKNDLYENFFEESSIKMLNNQDVIFQGETLIKRKFIDFFKK